MKVKRKCVECGSVKKVTVTKPRKVAKPVYRCGKCKLARERRKEARIKRERAELRKVISTPTIAEIASPFYADRVCGS